MIGSDKNTVMVTECPQIFECSVALIHGNRFMSVSCTHLQADKLQCAESIIIAFFISRSIIDLVKYMCCV